MPYPQGDGGVHDRGGGLLVEGLLVIADGDGALGVAAGVGELLGTSNHQARSSAGRDRATITGALPLSQ
jgi:hypothetical protein